MTHLYVIHYKGHPLLFTSIDIICHNEIYYNKKVFHSIEENRRAKNLSKGVRSKIRFGLPDKMQCLHSAKIYGQQHKMNAIAYDIHQLKIMIHLYPIIKSSSKTWVEKDLVENGLTSVIWVAGSLKSFDPRGWLSSQHIHILFSAIYFLKGIYKTENTIPLTSELFVGSFIDCNENFIVNAQCGLQCAIELCYLMHIILHTQTHNAHKIIIIIND